MGGLPFTIAIQRAARANMKKYEQVCSLVFIMAANLPWPNGALTRPSGM